MTEQQTQSKIIKDLEKRGAWVVKTIQTNKRGTPDILACLNGKFLAIEVKAPTGKLSPMQAVQLGRITTCGGIAFAAYSFDQYLINIDQLFI